MINPTHRPRRGRAFVETKTNNPPHRPRRGRAFVEKNKKALPACAERAKGK